LREDFEELYLYTKGLGMFVTIKTNATLITPHLAALFARVPPKMPIVITAYGVNKMTYEAVTRAPGSFEAFRRGVNLLIEYKVPFEIMSTILPLNINDINAFESWLLTLPCDNKTPSYSLFIDLRGRRDVAKNNILKCLRLTPSEVLEIQKRGGRNYFKEMNNFCKKFMHPQGDVLFSCSSGCERCSIDAYGVIQPCLLLRHPSVVYNLKNGSLKDAMMDFFPRIRSLKAVDQDYLSRCANCFLKGLCELCPAKSWMEHGTLDTPVDYLCEVAHAQARDLGLLSEGEKAWEVEDWRKRINSLSQN
jgi:radical SAM protein with 4Fe4S-binding SPASM domain